jgi:hypothetical protein
MPMWFAAGRNECMINMETSPPEAYPDGWWDLVVEVRTIRVCISALKCAFEWPRSA